MTKRTQWIKWGSFGEKDISPSKDASTVSVQLKSQHHRYNNIILNHIYVTRCPCNWRRHCSLFRDISGFLHFISQAFHSSDYWWNLDLGLLIMDLQEFRNNYLFITLCTAMHFIPGNDKFYIRYHIRSPRRNFKPGLFKCQHKCLTESKQQQNSSQYTFLSAYLYWARPHPHLSNPKFPAELGLSEAGPKAELSCVCVMKC